MTRLVEIHPESLAGVRSDVAATRDAVHEHVAPLRWRLRALGVPTGALDDALHVADRLGSHVLPTLDTHVARARDLASLRYGGAFGAALPVLDTSVPPTTPFAPSPLDDGSALLSWGPAPAEEQEADEQATRESRGIGDWFADRWGDVTDAVDDGVDRLAQTATDAWDAVTDAGAAIGDWWERTTADLGAWIDTNLADAREFIGRHVGVLRFLASACRVVGWVLVAVGAVLTIALTIIGAMGGAAIGAVFGFGVGAVPAGGAGAVAGLTFGLKVLGAGFSLVAVGDFLDVLGDWGEGKIDGQDLVQQGAVEIALAVTSLLGAGALGKIAQKTWKHLPASWKRRIDEALGALTPRRPLPDISDLDALHPRNGQPPGPWAQQVADRHGDLTPEEVQALYRYTTDPGYTEMNGYLRDPASYSPADAARIQADIDEAVAGLSKIETSPGVVLRGTDLPSSVLDRYRVGETVSDPAFWSTTTDPAVAQDFRNGGNALFELRTQSGVDVQRLSHYGAEAEILVPPGTQFEVLERTWNPSGYWEITLEEVL